MSSFLTLKGLLENGSDSVSLEHQNIGNTDPRITASPQVSPNPSAVQNLSEALQEAQITLSQMPNLGS